MKLSQPIAFSLLLMFACAALAQGTAPSVRVAPIQTIVVTRGSKAQLHIEMQVNKGFHINSNKPNNELLIPTVVRLSPPQGIMILNIQYPAGEQLSLPVMGEEKLSVYSGNFAVNAEVRIPKSAAFGTLRVHGEVKYQACNDRQCFPTKTTPLEFDVDVVKPKVKKSTYNPASPDIR